jgi:hypothetical protein
MVKFGQEPEEQFGITVNLERTHGNALENLYAKVQQRLDKEGMELLSGLPDEDNWPISEKFIPITKRSGWSEKAKSPKVTKKRSDSETKKVREKSREEADGILYHFWKAAYKADPVNYPESATNPEREQLLTDIEKGLSPEYAFARMMRQRSGSHIQNS